MNHNKNGTKVPLRRCKHINHSGPAGAMHQGDLIMVTITGDSGNNVMGLVSFAGSRRSS
jgi:hypothetical protein